MVKRHFKPIRKNHRGTLLKNLVALRQVALEFLAPLPAPKIRTSLKQLSVPFQMVSSVGGLDSGGLTASINGTMVPLLSTLTGKIVTIKIMLVSVLHHNSITDG